MRDGYFIQFAIQTPKDLFSEKVETIVTPSQIQSQIRAAEKTLKELRQRHTSFSSQENVDKIKMLETQLASMTPVTGKLRCPSYVEAVTNCLLTFCTDANQLYILPPDDEEFECLVLKQSPWYQHEHLKVDLDKENSGVRSTIDEIKKRFSAQIEPEPLKAEIASAIQRQQQQQQQQPRQQPQKGDDDGIEIEMMEFVPTGNVVGFDTSDASADVLSSASGAVSGAVSGASAPASGKANKNFFGVVKVKYNVLPHPNQEDFFPL
jgi:hypothetical protein